MFCRYCGNELPDDAKFCNSCGKSVFDASPPSELQNKEVAEKDYTKPGVSIQSANTISYKQAMEADAEYKKAKNKELVRKVNIISGIIAVIVVIIGVTYIYIDSKKLEEAFGVNDHDTGNRITITDEKNTVTDQSKPAPVEQLQNDSSNAEDHQDSDDGYYGDPNLSELPINKDYPFGYYEKNDGEGIEITYISDDDSISFGFFEAQGWYHGGQWMEPNFIVSSDWFDITSDTWKLNVDGVSIQFFIYGSHITVNASDSLGGMSADALSGNYYCLEQATDLQ